MEARPGVTDHSGVTKQAGHTSLSQLFGLTKQEIEAIATLGFQLYEQGKIGDAESIFNGLIALDSQIFYGYAGLGAMALAEEKLEESVSWLTRAVERNANDPTVHANLGEALLRQGHFSEAAEQLQMALKLDPKAVDAGVNRARSILAGMHVVIQQLQNPQAITA